MCGYLHSPCVWCNTHSVHRGQREHLSLSGLPSITVLTVNRSTCVCVQETCKKLAALIDKVDEDRYDLEIKVGKANKEVDVPGVGGAEPELWVW